MPTARAPAHPAPTADAAGTNTTDSPSIPRNVTAVEPAAVAPLADTVPRAVLDSNVWIDILVFDDPDSRPIRAALESGRLSTVTDARCLRELDRVLDYPQFERFAIDKAVALATVLRLATLHEHDDPAAPMDLVGQPTLPQCSDRDDQKFLELAAAAGADWLVTKDKALLKLSRRLARDFGCRIDRPPKFVAEAFGRDADADVDAHIGNDTTNLPVPGAYAGAAD